MWFSPLHAAGGRHRLVTYYCGSLLFVPPFGVQVFGRAKVPEEEERQGRRGRGKNQAKEKAWRRGTTKDAVDRGKSEAGGGRRQTRLRGG